MLKIGITGGIGSGKSLVSKILRSMNFPVFDSDEEAKRILRQNPTVRKQLIQLFGKAVYTKEELNRPILANIIFNDEVALMKINALIHPLVRHDFNEFAKNQKSNLIFNEAAILFESNGHEQLNKTILISAPKDLRIKRVMERDNCSKQDVLIRMNKQWTDEQKRKLADFEIVNDEKSPLIEQVEEVLSQIE